MSRDTSVEDSTTEAPTDRSLRFLYLKQEDVLAAGGLDMTATMADVEVAFSLRDYGQTKEPGSPMITWDGPHGRRILAHPAWVGGKLNRAGIKWIPSNPENPHVR